jgi:hypothetical protein
MTGKFSPNGQIFVKFPANSLLAGNLQPRDGFAADWLIRHLLLQLFDFG